MGHSGTESAREAAAIVLTDDDFATIIAALREGRRIRDNIRKFVAFLLSANLGEVLVFTVAIVGGFGVPLAVVQVLLVNLVTDGLPALALGQDPASAETMRIGERHGTRLFGNRDWLALSCIGLLIGSVTFAAFLAGRATDPAAAQTMAYATLALSELAIAFSIRSASSSRLEASVEPVASFKHDRRRNLRPLHRLPASGARGVRNGQSRGAGVGSRCRTRLITSPRSRNHQGVFVRALARRCLSLLGLIRGSPVSDGKRSTVALNYRCASRPTVGH